MSETKDMLKIIPMCPNNIHLKRPKPNAYICISEYCYGDKVLQKLINIYPIDGGCLSCDIENIEGDIAPFCD